MGVTIFQGPSFVFSNIPQLRHIIYIRKTWPWVCTDRLSQHISVPESRNHPDLTADMAVPSEYWPPLANYPEYQDALHSILYEDSQHPIYLAFPEEGCEDPISWHLVIWDKEKDNVKIWWRIHEQVEIPGPHCPGPYKGPRRVWKFQMQASQTAEPWKDTVWAWVSLGYAYTSDTVNTFSEWVHNVGEMIVENRYLKDDAQTLMLEVLIDIFGCQWVSHLRTLNVWEIEGFFEVHTNPLFVSYREFDDTFFQNVVYHRGGLMTKKYGTLGPCTCLQIDSSGHARWDSGFSEKAVYGSSERSLGSSADETVAGGSASSAGSVADKEQGGAAEVDNPKDSCLALV